MADRTAPGWMLALVVLAGLVGACGPVVELDATEPLAFVEQPRTSRILAPDGTVLADLHADQDRDVVPLADVADELVAAVVAVEDQRFFLHAGVDAASIGRAAIRNLEHGRVTQGGSTITQQLVKTTMTGPAPTIDRKIEEALLALRLERTHDKDEILEHYLNTVYFGRGAYGVGAAARRFFDVHPSELDLAQSALLAGVIASPSGFDPWEEPVRAAARRDVVLDAMVTTGRIGRAAAAAASATPIDVVARSSGAQPRPAEWVSSEVRRLVQHDPHGRFAEALGDSVEERAEALFTGGLRITTTVQLETQEQAERAVAERLPDDGPAAAVVVLDPDTGAIRALVGGRPEDAAVGFNLATQGRRSPGSAFKPIVLASALERGVPLDRRFPGGTCAVIDDVPGWDEQGACNYNGTDHPPMDLREATVRSANTVYARLAAQIGPGAIASTAGQLGITGPLREVHALGLGSEDVRVVDLASAYATFATLGERAEPYLVERIETADGDVLYEHEVRRERRLDEQVAWLVTDTLSDVVSRGTGVRAAIDRPQAGKTGTSQEGADAWFVGYTPELVAAVWVGFPEGRIPLRPPRLDEVVEGGHWPAEIWAEIASDALDGAPVREFPEPQVRLVTVTVDLTRNCLPNPYTPPEIVGERDYLRGTEPTEPCREPTGPTLEDVPQLVGLPVEVATRLLDDRGFAYEQRQEHSDVFPPGIVARQRPAGNEDLEPDEEVIVWGSVASRDRVAPPDTLGLGLAEATERLERAGFVVEVTRGCPCSRPPGTVHEQRPAGGIPTLRHAVVQLVAVPEDGGDPDGSAAAAAGGASGGSGEPIRGAPDDDAD